MNDRADGVEGRRWRRIGRHPFVHLFAALTLIALIQGFFVKAYQVPSGSMEQTLIPGDRLLVNRLAFLRSEPVAGDIVVFKKPEAWNETETHRGALRTIVGWFGGVVGFGPSNSAAMVKRIIAGPGESIFCCNEGGRMVRDGTPIEEVYLGSDFAFRVNRLDCSTSPASRRCFPQLTVPEGHYLMMGDNRASSSDGISPCRDTGHESGLDCARLVPRDDIVGAVFAVVLPIDRWEVLN